MKIPWTDGFAAESARFSFRHVCEDCALFDAEQRACAHEYPIAVHERAYYDARPDEIVFCKEFELR